MEQIPLPFPANSAQAAAHSAVADSPLPADLLARVVAESLKPSKTDTRYRRLVIMGCVPAYYRPATEEPPRLTDALRERNFTFLDAARALLLTIDQVEALERMQGSLSSREVLVITSALDQYAATRRNEHTDTSALVAENWDAITQAYIAWLRRIPATRHPSRMRRRKRCAYKGGR